MKYNLRYCHHYQWGCITANRLVFNATHKKNFANLYDFDLKSARYLKLKLKLKHHSNYLGEGKIHEIQCINP